MGQINHRATECKVDTRHSHFQVDTWHCQKFDPDTRHSHPPSWALKLQIGPRWPRCQYHLPFQIYFTLTQFDQTHILTAYQVNLFKSHTIMKTLKTQYTFLGPSWVKVRTVYCYLGMWPVKIQTMSAGKTFLTTMNYNVLVWVKVAM